MKFKKVKLNEAIIGILEVANVSFSRFYPKEKIYSWLGAVLPEYRRKGVATKLMKILFIQAKKGGYKIVEVKTHKGHPEMISLLRKEGFKKTKVEKNHWGIGKDAIFYEKNLKV
jgi:ribosomal protein S18 acetylase RimI-like enzyme